MNIAAAPAAGLRAGLETPERCGENQRCAAAAKLFIDATLLRSSGIAIPGEESHCVARCSADHAQPNNSIV